MQIQFDKKTVNELGDALEDAFERAADDEDTGLDEAAADALADFFTPAQVAEIEKRSEGEFFDFLVNVVSEWEGDDLAGLLKSLSFELEGLDIELKVDEAALAEVLARADDEEFEDDGDNGSGGAPPN